MKHATRWDLPKGHVDPGESELECALRELWEETGIPQEAIELDPQFRYTQQYRVSSERDGEALKTLVIFLGRLLQETPISTTEHLGHEWHAWQPPHRIQTQTIDPLLSALEKHLTEKS